MMKKGMEMAMGTIVAIVLGLIILVILIIFAQQQVSKGSKNLGEIGKESEYAADKCQSIIKGTFCAASCGEGYESFNSPSGTGWADCGKAKGLESKGSCCRKKVPD